MESWTDLNVDGRRLNATIRMMHRLIQKTNDEELKLSYIDRLIKATHEKACIAKTVLGVEELLKDAKNYPQLQA